MLTMQADEFLNAIKMGEQHKVGQLLKSNPSLAESRDKNGASAILYALYTGHREIAAAIAAEKQELDVFEAASLGDLKSLESLVKKGENSVHAYSPDGFTALALAAYLGQKDAVQYLVERGADPNAVAKNPTGFTALTGAVAQNYTEVARVLVKGGADVNHRYEGGFTPLAHAAHAGNIELVKLLLENGADPNARTAEGKTPLIFAHENGHGEVISLLMKHGAIQD